MTTKHPSPREQDTRIARRHSSERSSPRKSKPGPPLPEAIGEYRVVRRIGAGGMAEIFLAERVLPGGARESAVLKRILPAYTGDPSFVEMFRREARVVTRLDHPNIVRVFDLIDDDGDCALVMEYLDGYTVRDLVRRAWKLGRSLPLEIASAIVKGTARGLSYAHELTDARGAPLHLVHRDVAPDNIFVTRNGRIKLLDFGLAKPAQGDGLTKAGEIKGKLRFMSPEQLAGKDVDARTDVFALGVAFYWMLTGERPFDGEHDVDIMHKILEVEPRAPRRINPMIPPEVESIVAACLQKDRARRAPSTRAVETALDRAMGGVFATEAAVAAFLADVEAAEPPAERRPPRYACAPQGALSEAPLQRMETVVVDPSGATRIVRSGSGERSPRPDEREATRIKRQDAALTAALTGLDLDAVLDPDEDAPTSPPPSRSPAESEPAPRARPTLAADAPSTPAPPEPDLAEPTRTLGPDEAHKLRAALEGARRIAGAGVSGDDDALHPPIGPDKTASGRTPVETTGTLTNTEVVQRRKRAERSVAPVVAGVTFGAALLLGGGVAVWQLGILDGARDASEVATARSVEDVAAIEPKGPPAPVDEPPPDGDAPPVREPPGPKAPPVEPPPDDEPPQREPPPAREPPPGEEPPAPVEEPPSEDGPPAPVEGATPPRRDAPDRRPAKTAAAKAATKAVKAIGPASIRWSTSEGKALGAGPGSYVVPERVTSLVAVDPARGARSAVPIRGGVADYGALGTGELVVRARPWAEVRLGRSALGMTPIQPLSVVAGTYKVELVYNDVTKVKTVEVAPGGRAIVQVDMRDP